MSKVYLVPGVSGKWFDHGFHQQLAETISNYVTVSSMYSSYSCFKRQLYISNQLSQCPNLASTWIGHSEGAARILLACQQKRLQGKVKHIILISPAYALHSSGPIDIEVVLTSIDGIQVSLIETDHGFGSFTHDVREANAFRNFVDNYTYGSVYQLNNSHHNLLSDRNRQAVVSYISKSMMAPPPPASIQFFGDTHGKDDTWLRVLQAVPTFDILFVEMQLCESEKPTKEEQMLEASYFGNLYFQRIHSLQTKVQIVGLAKRWQRPYKDFSASHRWKNTLYRSQGSLEVDWVRSIFRTGSQCRCAAWVGNHHLLAMQNWIRAW